MPDRDTRSGVTGALLAGGRATRMHGSDKAMLTLGGLPMIAHVVARLCPQVGRILINANGDPARFAGLGLPVVPDRIEGSAGPLAGLHASLAWAARATPDARYVASVPADTPFLPADLVARLSTALREAGAACAVAASGGRRHSVVGLWDVALADAAARALERGERAMHRFAQAQGCAVAGFPLLKVGGVDLDPFFNVNTPDDLERAGALVAALAKPHEA